MTGTVPQRNSLDNIFLHVYTSEQMAGHAKNGEFASTRLSNQLFKRVFRMAEEEKRSLSSMLRILIEEAVQQREEK
jgi:hypothetical protein